MEIFKLLLKIFSVYDSKAEAYLPPFFMQYRGQAVRAYGDTADDPSHQFGKHPQDYTLFELGEWDDSNGSFNIYLAPHCLGVATEFMKKQEFQKDILKSANLVK